MSDSQNDKPIRLDPIVTIDSAFFWEGATRGELLIQQCTDCETLWHPPRPMCPKCLGLNLAPKKMSGRATLYSWAMPIHPPAYGFTMPPITALVELEEGPRLVTNVVGVDPREIKAGLALEVEFAPTKGGKAVPIFHPAQKGA